MIDSIFNVLTVLGIAILLGVPFEARSQETDDTQLADKDPGTLNNEETNGQEANEADAPAEPQEPPTSTENDAQKKTDTTESNESTAAPVEETDTATPLPPASPEPVAFPESPPPAKEEDAEEKEEIQKTTGEIATWSLVGVAGLGVISGGIFGITALDEKRRDDDNPNDAFNDRHKSRSVAAYVSFGVAGAAAVAALIVGLTTDWVPESAPIVLGTDGTSIQITF